MKPVYNKILLKIRPDGEQPKKTFLTPDAELLKHFEVLDIGSEIKDEISVGSVVTCYVNHVHMLNHEIGFCSFRDPIFVDNRPRKDKVQVEGTETLPMTNLSVATAVKSSNPDVSDGDKVVYIPGQSHILPDNTELISITQILSKDVGTSK